MENNKNFKNRENGRVIAGLILVGVGAILLLRNSGFFLPNWLFTWPMILILVGIYSGVKHNFRNNSWLILLAIGGFFLFDRIVPNLGIEPYFWPILIIGVGILFILRPKKDRLFSCDVNEKKNYENTGTTAWQNTESNFTTDDSNNLIINSVFSGVNKKIVSKNLQGGKVSCVFGGADIDLTQADIQGEVIIKFEVVFGGVKLVIPPHWTVDNHIDGVFHGVDDKRKFNTSADISSAKKLILKGSVVFGGVEIRSY